MNRLAILALPLLALGCASGGSLAGSTAPASDRQAALERRVLELEKEAVRARLELERLRRRVAELDAAAAPAPTPPPAPEAPAPLPPAAPPAPSTAASELEVSDLEEPGESAPATAPETRAPGTEGGDYEAALRLLRDGHAAEAESALAAFVAAYPASDLADNAWFWIGEARLVRQDTAGAAQAYRAAIEKYPNGNKIPDALFKLGHCLALAGDEAGAAEVWRELVRRFPGTVAAERARDRLGARPGS
jgi:tol-pal system protein YbgF